MPLQVMMTEETVVGVCEGCGRTDHLQRFFVETKEHSGNTPALCLRCRQGAPIRADLADAEQSAGPRPPSRRRRKAVSRQERETAELIGGRVQKASGAMLSAKGDVRLKGVLRGEMKSTEKKSFILKRAVLDKIRSECVGGEKPFLTVRFIHPVTMATEDEWVLIPIENWEHNASTKRT